MVVGQHRPPPWGPPRVPRLGSDSGPPPSASLGSLCQCPVSLHQRLCLGGCISVSLAGWRGLCPSSPDPCCPLVPSLLASPCLPWVGDCSTLAQFCRTTASRAPRSLGRSASGPGQLGIPPHISRPPSSARWSGIVLHLHGWTSVWLHLELTRAITGESFTHSDTRSLAGHLFLAGGWPPTLGHSYNGQGPPAGGSNVKTAGPSLQIFFPPSPPGGGWSMGHLLAGINTVADGLGWCRGLPVSGLRAP